MYNTINLIEDLPKIWRIIVSVILFQLIGSAIGLAIGFHHSSFENLWMGGAVATPIGFLAGLIWHIKSVKEPERKSNRTVVFLGIIAIFLGAIAIFFVVPESIREMKLIESFKNINSSNVRQIMIYDRHGEKLIKTVSDSSKINDFTSSCNDTKGNSPNHPHYTTSWYVKIDTDEPIELECHYQAGRPSTLIGYFVKKRGTSTRFYGSFSSVKLRDWFEKYVETSP